MGLLSAAVDRAHLWNPVLVKELRTRMRGSRPAWLQAGYVLIILLFMGGAYALEAGARGAAMAGTGYRFGTMLYHVIFTVQAVLVVLIVPGLTAGSVSGEQEQRTYDSLASTRLRPRQVVLGKLLSAWLFAALLLTTSLPLAALCMLFGGVSPAELLWSYGLIGLAALFFASLALWWSTATPRTLVAVIGSYVTVGVFMILTAMPAGARYIVSSASIFASVNPVAAIYYAADPAFVYGWTIPAGVAAAVLLVLASLLFTAAASQRLPLIGRRSGIWVRTLLLALLGVSAFLAMGSLGPTLISAVNPARAAVAVGATALITVLAALAPVVAAGEINEPLTGTFAAWLLGGFSPRRLLQPRVRSAFPFLALCAIAGCAVIAAGVLYFAPTQHAGLWHALWRAAGLALATIFGCSMLGLWLALTMPGTRGRVVLAAGLAIAYVLTLTVVIGASAAGSPYPGAGLAYLNPALIVMSYADQPMSPPALRNALHGWFGLDRAETSMFILIALGVIGLLGPRSAFRRRAASGEVSDG